MPNKVCKLLSTLAPSPTWVAQWVLLPGPQPQWVRQLGKNYARTGKRFHRISHFLYYIIWDTLHPTNSTDYFSNRIFPQHVFWSWANTSKTLSVHFSLMTTGTSIISGGKECLALAQSFSSVLLEEHYRIPVPFCNLCMLFHVWATLWLWGALVLSPITSLDHIVKIWEIFQANNVNYLPWKRLLSVLLEEVSYVWLCS